MMPISKPHSSCRLVRHEQRQISSDVPARIYEWTEGDVYLSHKLCAGLARDIPAGAILLTDVDRAARRHLYEDEIFRKMWRQITPIMMSR